MIDLEDIKKDVVNRVLVSSGKRLISKEVMSGLNLIQTLAQQEISQLKKEIESLTSKHGSAIGKLHFTEKKLGEAQQEISELKAKLAKYESDDVVVMPRIPSDEMVEAMGYAVCNMGGDCWLDTDEAYKAIIEKGEIE